MHSSHCSTLLTAAHPIHTRSPDVPARLVHQRLLVNSFCTSDLCRPHERSAAADLPQAMGAAKDQRRPIPADLAHAVSILGSYVHLPGLHRLAYQRIANYLIRTKSIRCDGAAEFENSDASQMWCRKHQAGLTLKTDADWYTADALNAIYTAVLHNMPHTLDPDSEAASDADDFDAPPAFEDSDSDAD
jgi:hypothetical protein